MKVVFNICYVYKTHVKDNAKQRLITRNNLTESEIAFLEFHSNSNKSLNNDKYKAMIPSNWKFKYENAI